MHSTLSYLVKDRRLDKKKRRWIRSNVSRRECVSFVSVADNTPREQNTFHEEVVYRSLFSGGSEQAHPLPTAAEDDTADGPDTTVCRCGKTQREHPEATEEPVRSLDYRVFSEKVPTDVCVELVDSRSMERQPMVYSPKQIVRIAADSDPEVLKDLVTVWRVPKANHLVSLYGSMLHLEAESKGRFEKECITLLETLANPGNAFLSVSSTGEDLYKLCLEGMCPALGLNLLPTCEIIPVAFQQWADLSLYQKMFLLKATVSNQAQEVNEFTTQDQLGLLLARSNGYVLLADYGVEQHTQKLNYVFPFPLRRRMEDVLRQHTHDVHRQGSLMVLCGGTFADLAAIYSALLSGVPVIVMKNSGGAADILSKVLEKTKNMIEESVENEDGKTVRRSRTVAAPDWLQRKVEGIGSTSLPPEDFHRFKAHLGRVVIGCLDQRHLITLCDVTTEPKPYSRPVLVEAAVEAFIKSHSDEDGVEFFKKNIYRLVTESGTHPVKKAQRTFQRSLFRKALELERADLLEVLVNRGFVTEDEALESSFWSDTKSLDDFYAFENRKEYVRKIILADQRPTWSSMTVVQHLFLASVVTNKLSLSLHFWKRGTDQITSALIAHHLSNHMASRAKDGSDTEAFKEQAREFESLAIGTMQECYRQDPKQTMAILTSNASPFPINPMEAAVWFEIKSFIAELAPSVYLESVWRGQNSGAKAGSKKKRTACRTFRTSPRTTCAVSTLFYVLFLSLYGHVLIFELGKELSPWDLTLAVWVAAFIVEELVTAVNPVKFLSTDRSKSEKVCTRVKAHFDDWWNYMDVVALSLFIIGFVLHAVPGPDAMRETGRVVLCLDYLVFFLRLLKNLTVSKHIGPMLPMIWNMLGDLIPFLVILFVFIFAYAVSMEALLHPDTDWHPLYLLYLPRVGFWAVFNGGPESADAEENCTVNKSWYMEDGGATCPTQTGRHVGPVLTGFYMLITNVLMLNLLIAYFSDSYQLVKAESNIWWAWLRCGLLREYHDCCPLPPPFTLLYRLLQLLRLLLKLLLKGLSSCCLRICCRCLLSDHLTDTRPLREPSGYLARTCGAEDFEEELMRMPGDRGAMVSRRREFREQYAKAFDEEGDILDIIDMDEFRFTYVGQPAFSAVRASNLLSEAPGASKLTDSKDSWEAVRAAVHLAARLKSSNASKTWSASRSDKQKAQETADALSRLEKKIEDHKVYIRLINTMLQKMGPALSSGTPHDSASPQPSPEHGADGNGTACQPSAPPDTRDVDSREAAQPSSYEREADGRGRAQLRSLDDLEVEEAQPFPDDLEIEAQASEDD